MRHQAKREIGAVVRRVRFRPILSIIQPAGKQETAAPNVSKDSISEHPCAVRVNPTSPFKYRSEVNADHPKEFPTMKAERHAAIISLRINRKLLLE